mmetsp:Transcript_4963/g.10160  ORF Transcript_4963/g.10160 Transcript_4963/m.10160 type:complete len:254 (+) Transcript_4963:74-835(+)
MSLTCCSVSASLATCRRPSQTRLARHQFGATCLPKALVVSFSRLDVKWSSQSFYVWAKRTQKKKQARKLERREETREFEEMVMRAKEKAAQEAKKRPPAVPAPTTAEEAQERVKVAFKRAQMAVAHVKQLKLEARESDEFNPDIGYKAFPEVMDAVDELDACKARVHEEMLERALLKMSEITGKPRSLDSFNWRFGDGTDRNASCCGYMLQACQKGGMMEVASEIVPVLEDAGVLGQLDDKILRWLENVPIQA